MGIFNLTSISFDKNPIKRTGDSTKNLVGSEYNSNTFKYPIDLGSYDKGHYMVIHVNEQIKTSYVGTASQDVPTIFKNRQKLNASVGDTGISTLQVVGDNIDQYGPQFKEIYEGVTQSTGFIPGNEYRSALDVRTIRRTTDTIALYMPDTLNFTHEQGYSEITLGGGLFAAAGAVLQTLKEPDPKASALKNASPFILNALSRLGGNIGNAAFAGGFGFTTNPALEVLYSSPKLRSFKFEFMFYPRSRKEAQEVQNILSRLRFHQAPELLGSSNAGGVGGFFLVPPSEFDIEFYYNGKINKNIPKISTCALEIIDIDYAPNGFSAYEVPNDSTNEMGGTGMPTAIRLNLQFKELEMLTKSNFNEDAKRTSSEEYDRSSFRPRLDVDARY
jgi:hypothetical protein